MNQACAAHGEYSSTGTQGNLFLLAPDTDLSEFLRETARFAERHPEIITEIDGQLDSSALGKKRMRISDQEFIDAQTQCLSGFEPSSGAGTGDSPGVSLKPGVPA